MENPPEQKLDGFQSEVGQQFDSLQCSISKLAQQLDHKGEENPEDECLIETILGEQAQLQPQEELKVESVEVPPEELQNALQLGIINGPWKKEEREEPQKLILHLNPINLDPSANAQATYNPLPVYILPTPAANSKPAVPAPKAKFNPSLPAMQKFKKLVANVQIFATTSKKMTALSLHGIVDGSGAGSDLEHPNPGISELR